MVVLEIKFVVTATTKLAYHSNETSKDKLSIIYNWLSIIGIQVHAKLHKNLFISTCSVFEKFVKTSFMAKNTHLLNGHNVVGAHWNRLMCTNNICY